MPKSNEAAKKALELDDTLAEAHIDMAIVHYWYDYDWNAAEKEFRRAIELRPNYAQLMSTMVGNWSPWEDGRRH